MQDARFRGRKLLALPEGSVLLAPYRQAEDRFVARSFAARELVAQMRPAVAQMPRDEAKPRALAELLRQ